jgi:hypothetical protein
MSISCVICGLWYPEDAPDRLDICRDCHAKNFAGASPPLEPSSPSARAALDAYVSIQPPPSPLQVEALLRVQARWVLEGTGGEDLA